MTQPSLFDTPVDEPRIRPENFGSEKVLARNCPTCQAPQGAPCVTVKLSVLSEPLAGKPTKPHAARRKP